MWSRGKSGRLLLRPSGRLLPRRRHLYRVSLNWHVDETYIRVCGPLSAIAAHSPAGQGMEVRVACDRCERVYGRFPDNRSPRRQGRESVSAGGH